LHNKKSVSFNKPAENKKRGYVVFLQKQKSKNKNQKFEKAKKQRYNQISF